VIFFLLVLGIIAFFLNYLSKQKGVKTMVGGKNNLRIVDTCSLGNRQFIVVTQYESERHLLAVSTSGISHLAKLSSQSSPPNDSPKVTD
jgi:flagellar biogenesis protein FliO